MTKDEKKVELKKLKREQKVLLQNLSRIAKAKETKSALIVIKRAFRILDNVMKLAMLQQEMITVVSQSNIIFPNGGPIAKLNCDSEKVISEELKNVHYFSELDDKGRPIQFHKFEIDSASSAE